MPAAPNAWPPIVSPVGKTVFVDCQGPEPEPTCEFCTQPSLPTTLELQPREGTLFFKETLTLWLSANIESHCFVTFQSCEVFSFNEASVCKEYSVTNELEIAMKQHVLQNQCFNYFPKKEFTLGHHDSPLLFWFWFETGFSV